jgi:hypothetical protein
MARDIVTGIKDWFTSRLPQEWFEDIAVQADGDEILVVGTLADSAGSSAETRIADFRERTREQRIEIASDAEELFNRKVSWGVRSGETTALFTHLSVPVMTRLRLPERAVLDTLIAAGVARSRSHALAWCAKLVGEHQAEWIDKLRQATAEVDKVRREGPANVTMV